jgi:hypothetical protein
MKEKEFGFPLILTIRFDTEFPKGSFYRPWYGKQYRRTIERMNKEFYRYTFSTELKSGDIYPEFWTNAHVMRQDFSFVIPAAMSEGEYEIRMKVWRKAYLENRRLADYFSNDDSKQGEKVAVMKITAER